ncbi:DUF4320 family protein [Paenibacillus sp. FSL F4-0122]|uniref:DUF4320 family protein n=1 Tax=Paenibacillus graminis TaxID=189425 RepID=A0A089NMI5_9BACL|nr:MULTISPECIES: DUF4320 family protein [Paenibacillus]AIQ70264.1 hypothetical protein PGRAT_23385 [Paenibacillus graminis]OZQ77413.1 hypothetical protein CA596_07550 [Paenibacillus odorifer]
MKHLINKRGEGYVDVVVLVMAVMLCVALVVKVIPVFVTKYQLDTFAAELAREAEISGRVGQETTQRAAELQAQTGLHPTISWSKTGQIQINQEFTVTLNTTVNIGLFGDFGSFPIELTAKGPGKSEVYWK